MNFRQSLRPSLVHFPTTNNTPSLISNAAAKRLHGYQQLVMQALVSLVGRINHARAWQRCIQGY